MKIPKKYHKNSYVIFEPSFRFFSSIINLSKAISLTEISANSKILRKREKRGFLLASLICSIDQTRGARTQSIH